MELLFRREQTSGRFSRVTFKLWAKLEVTEDEQAIIDRYGFKNAVLVVALQPELISWAMTYAVFVFFITFGLLASFGSYGYGIFFGIVAGLGFAYWYILSLIHI